MEKHFVLAEVKAVKEPTNPNGEWEAVLSAPTMDRDGEVIAKGAFDPLPDSIPIHAFHAFDDPIGRGEPFYDGDLLKARGGYASTLRAQEIKTLVQEGVIANMSVGFMAAEREERDGVQTVTKAELLEASFVSVPSNREAAVLMAKGYLEKGVPTVEGLQAVHDLLVANGADCKEGHKTFTELPDLKTDDDEESTEEAAAQAAAESVEESSEEVEETEDEQDLRARAIALLGES